MLKPLQDLEGAALARNITHAVTIAGRIILISLVVSSFTYGQRRATRPASKPGTSVPTEATQRRVSITLKTGETVTGNLISADASVVHVQVGGNNLTIKWDDIVTIQPGDASTITKMAAPPEKEAKLQQPETAKTAMLPIEVALIFNSGDVKPAARTDFVLLDEDLNVILKPFPSLGTVSNNWEKGPPITAYSFDREIRHMEGEVRAISELTRYGLRHISGERAAEVMAEVQEIRKSVAAHVIASVITDLTGKATFEGLPAGRSFLFGTYETGNNRMSWYMPVDLKPGMNPKLTLSNDNSI